MEMATKIQIDVIGKIEGTQFMKCKLYTNENIVIIMMNEFDYERLKEDRKSVV